jgi:hypothetical protein
LIYADNYKLTELENQFVEELRKVKDEVNAVSYQ